MPVLVTRANGLANAGDRLVAEEQGRDDAGRLAVHAWQGVLVHPGGKRLGGMPQPRTYDLEVYTGFECRRGLAVPRRTAQLRPS